MNAVKADAGIRLHEIPCQRCRSPQRLYQSSCSFCNGKGFVMRERKCARAGCPVRGWFPAIPPPHLRGASNFHGKRFFSADGVEFVMRQFGEPVCVSCDLAGVATKKEEAEG